MKNWIIFAIATFTVFLTIISLDTSGGKQHSDFHYQHSEMGSFSPENKKLIDQFLLNDRKINNEIIVYRDTHHK